jgi:DNA-binding MarR family transcriptional regulator
MHVTLTTEGRKLFVGEKVNRYFDILFMAQLYRYESTNSDKEKRIAGRLSIRIATNTMHCLSYNSRCTVNRT